MKRKSLFSLLLAACLAFMPAICSAAQAYQITARELDRLDTNLTELRNINDRQSRESGILKSQLAESQTRLTEAERQSRTLQEQLDGLKLTMEGQAQSLQNANRLLKQYEEEGRARLRCSRWQTNFAYIVAATAIYFAIRKS